MSKYLDEARDICNICLCCFLLSLQLTMSQWFWTWNWKLFTDQVCYCILSTEVGFDEIDGPVQNEESASQCNYITFYSPDQLLLNFTAGNIRTLTDIAKVCRSSFCSSIIHSPLAIERLVCWTTMHVGTGSNLIRVYVPIDYDLIYISPLLSRSLCWHCLLFIDNMAVTSKQ